MKTIFNAEALVSVTIKGKELVWDLKYKPYNKSFWNGTTEEGFYAYPCGTYCYTATSLRLGKWHGIELIVEGQKAYYYPNVTLKFTNSQSYNKVFGTYEEALKWGEEQSRLGMNVQITGE